MIKLIATTLIMIVLLCIISLTFYYSESTLILLLILLGPTIAFTIASFMTKPATQIDVKGYADASNYGNLNKLGRGK